MFLHKTRAYKARVLTNPIFSLFFPQTVLINKHRGVSMVEASQSHKAAYVLKKGPHGIICKVSSLNNPSGLQEADVYAPQSCIARQMFLSSGANGYDARHRLEPWKEYFVVFLSASIVQNAVRNTMNMLTAAKTLGYKQPCAGITPRILGIIDDSFIRRMRQEGCRQVIVPHPSITIIDPVSKSNRLFVFCIQLASKVPSIDSFQISSSELWGTEVRFLFFADLKSSSPDVENPSL